MSSKEALNQKYQSLLQMLDVLSRKSAKAITYTAAALGILATIPSIHLPPELALLATGLGVEAIGSVLDKIAHEKNLDDSQVVLLVEQAIASSEIDKLLTKDSFFSAFSHLLKKQNKVAANFEEIFIVLRRLENNLIPSQGLTYSDARQIAQDVFEANFYKLSSVAQKTASARAEQFINIFFQRYSEMNPSDLSWANDPDMQYVFYLAQITYARYGNDEILELLIEILTNRAVSESTTVRISLNESISAISKLTPTHCDLLSFMFLVQIAKPHKIFADRQDFSSYLEIFREKIYPYVKDIPIKTSEYVGYANEHSLFDIYAKHLVYTGCALYVGYFPHQDDPEYYPSQDLLLEWTYYDKEEKAKRLKSDWFIKLRTVNSYASQFRLTSVGICIAIANIRQKTNDVYNILKWVSQ